MDIHISLDNNKNNFASIKEQIEFIECRAIELRMEYMIMSVADYISKNKNIKNTHISWHRTQNGVSYYADVYCSDKNKNMLEQDGFELEHIITSSLDGLIVEDFEKIELYGSTFEVSSKNIVLDLARGFFGTARGGMWYGEKAAIELSQKLDNNLENKPTIKSKKI